MPEPRTLAAITADDRLSVGIVILRDIAAGKRSVAPSAEMATALADAVERDVAMRARLGAELREAEHKAWDSLARYKFLMFGYWCAIWVHVNRIAGGGLSNPWRGLMKAARLHQAGAMPGVGQNAAAVQGSSGALRSTAAARPNEASP